MELATVSDIGRLLGVSKQRASQITGEKDKSFPKPLGKCNEGRTPIWRMRDVRRWDRARKARAAREQAAKEKELEAASA